MRIPSQSQMVYRLKSRQKARHTLTFSRVFGHHDGHTARPTRPQPMRQAGCAIQPSPWLVPWRGRYAQPTQPL